MSMVVICSSVVSSVCAAVPLSDVFSPDCGKVVASKYLKAIGSDVGDKWVELADELDMNTDEIPHKRPGNLRCRRMLENWVEKNGDNAMICVLCDALYACGLQHVADRHFGHIVDTVLRKQTNTELSTELFLVSYETPVQDLIGGPHSQCIVEMSKVLDRPDKMGDDWRRLWSELLNRPFNEEVVSRTEEGPTHFLLKLWCRTKPPSQATVAHLVEALNSMYRNDVARIVGKYCKVGIRSLLYWCDESLWL